MMIRWFFIGLATFLFLGSNFYYRVLGTEWLYGPPKWVVPADDLMPPLVLVVFFFVLLVSQFVKAVNQEFVNRYKSL
ncbi:hypothetical protein [Leptospira biflexa]|nr:hypothetical protein [Leptospira biflexa]